MICLTLFIFCVIVALGTGLLAGWSDFKGMTIPNTCHVLILGAFALAAVCVYLSPTPVFEPLRWHLGAAVVTFVVTFIMFQLRLMGGGDSKLLTVYALWVAFAGLPSLLFYTALIGALVGIAALIIKRRKPFANPPEKSWIGRVQAGESRVPYGIPIVCGAFISFWQSGYLSPDKLALFLPAAGGS